VRDFQAGVLELSGTGKKFKCGIGLEQKGKIPSNRRNNQADVENVEAKQASSAQTERRR
jgi:hypothetical protein